jgi:hypothetical protein
MAITRLTDLVTVFESKWVYGDVKFGYDGEVNQDHDTKYPLMLIQPPSSVIPVVYEGREEYEFEMNFYNLYSQDAQSVVELQKRWDNLQDLANEWLDFVLKNYQDSTVEAFLNDESIEIERVKDVANDKLVQIKLTFTMSGFTKCFRPTSNFPTDYEDLQCWLSADSLATFDIPNKRVSSLGDRSGRDNKVIQVTTAAQPLRIGFDGINDKTYFSFNGDNNLYSPAYNPISTKNFTIFEVSKFGDIGEVCYSYEEGSSPAQIRLGLDGNDKYYSHVRHGGASSLVITTITSTASIIGQPHIGVFRVNHDGEGIEAVTEYYDENTQQTASGSAIGEYGAYNERLFEIGALGDELKLTGEFNELIIYDRALTDVEVDDIVGYLNYKYKIY